MSDDEDEQREYQPEDLARIGREWIERIKESEKREHAWRDAAEKAEAAFLCDDEADGAEVPEFNILHSNVETIVPAIYNSTPRPDIRPNHPTGDPNQDKPIKYIADLHERVITSLIDDNALDMEIEAGAQDAFMAGRDIVRIRFDANVEELYLTDPMTGEEIPQGNRVTEELVIYENVSWRDFRMGPAKRWRDVPWVAYGHEVSEEEREKLENPEFKIEGEKKDQPKDCYVWEIWCKETKRVYFVVEDTRKVLDIVDDPLGLKGFFPQARPVQPITGTGKMTPVCPYTVYKSLAEELDVATRRIRKIMSGLKVRGVIAGDATIADLISQTGDWDLVPVPNLENLAATGGLDKAIMWWPIDTAVAVLRELYVQREQTKQAIYEVTGISDIVRGQGAASETATAQQIKTQWGSLRVRKMQRMIERQVRDLFVLTAEVVSKHFTAQRIQQLSGMELPPQLEPVFRQFDQFKIDVESDSTVRADLTNDRQEMSEFLQGTAAFFQTMAPLVQQSPKAAGPLAKMYSAFASQFNLGKAAEDALDQFVQMAEQASQQPQGPSPEQQKMEMEAKLSEAKFQLDTEKFKLDAAKFQAEHGLKRDSLKLDEAKAEVEAAATMAEIEMEDDQQRPVAFNQNGVN